MNKFCDVGLCNNCVWCGVVYDFYKFVMKELVMRDWLLCV